MAEEKKIGVALIGAGIWATEEHLPAIKASKHLVLKAVYSRRQASTKTIVDLCPDIDVYSDDSGRGFDDILKRDDIGAVIIALSIASQKQYILAALKAGKHVLSEKPVAENLEDARQMIEWYRASENKVAGRWHVAENWRFMSDVQVARTEVAKLGRILGFRVQVYANIKKGWKFFETEWRKDPTHQGGFLLDGGVHNVAGLRLLLGVSPQDQVSKISAFTTLLQPHLPPVDTINAILKLESGISGTYQQSCGTSLTGSEWTIGCEHGSVTLTYSKVTIKTEGKVIEQKISNERTGVPPLVRAWGEALAEGGKLEMVDPEEALADLEMLELMLRSGEKDGELLTCHHQHVPA